MASAVNTTLPNQSTPAPASVVPTVNPATGGPSYQNKDDNARIVSNGENIAVISETGDSVSYLPKSDSFMLQRRANNERIAGLGNGAIGLDQGKVEIAIDKRGSVSELGTTGNWSNLGSIQSQVTQQALARDIDGQAFNDLTNVVAHKGALGGIDMKPLHIAPSSLAILNSAQTMKRQERLNAQRAAVKAQTIAAEQRDPAPAPIMPLDMAIQPHREAPPADANAPYLSAVEGLSQQPAALNSPLPQSASPTA